MEDSIKGDTGEPELKLLHCRLKSTKYKIKLELFWSRKFIEGLRSFNNRALTNALKLVDQFSDMKELDEALPQDWVITKEIRENSTAEELDAACTLSWNQLIRSIEIKQVARSLESLLNNEDSKDEELKAGQQHNDSINDSPISIQ